MLFTMATMIPMINAPGLAPIFITTTRYYSAEKRNHIARKVAIGGFALLLGTVVIGTRVLGFFGISIAIVKLTGGLLVASSGLSYLKSKDFDDDKKEDKALIAAEANSHGSSGAFYPLTFPLSVGPGSISVVITLGSHFPPDSSRDLSLFIGTVIGLALTCLWLYICYRYAPYILKHLGDTGTMVLLRLSAFILMCVGFQLVWNGVEILIRSLK